MDYLLDLVKESGIVKIIEDYKHQMEVLDYIKNTCIDIEMEYTIKLEDSVNLVELTKYGCELEDLQKEYLDFPPILNTIMLMRTKVYNEKFNELVNKMANDINPTHYSNMDLDEEDDEYVEYEIDIIDDDVDMIEYMLSRGI